MGPHEAPTFHLRVIPCKINQYTAIWKVDPPQIWFKKLPQQQAHHPHKCQARIPSSRFLSFILSEKMSFPWGWYPRFSCSRAFSS